MDSEENYQQEQPMTRVDYLHKKTKEEIKFMKPSRKNEDYEECDLIQEDEDCGRNSIQEDNTPELRTIEPLEYSEEEDYDHDDQYDHDYLNQMINVEEGLYFMEVTNIPNMGNLPSVPRNYLYAGVAGIVSLVCGAYLWFRRG